MGDDVKYDSYYREDPAACGAPFVEFESFCGEVAPGSVLDLGCGQGRDALVFARAGHSVLGVDLSSVGIAQMLAVAKAEALDVQGVVASICEYQPDRQFDVVILDRVLHMLPADARVPALEMALDAVSPGGHLLLAEGPKNMKVLREVIAPRGWEVVCEKTNRLIVRRGA